jgi:Flp pilus assembly protein TadD
VYRSTARRHDRHDIAFANRFDAPARRGRNCNPGGGRRRRLRHPATGSHDHRLGRRTCAGRRPAAGIAGLGERYRADPRDPVAAINYAQALRGLGQRAQAVAVLEQASLHNTSNMELLGAYGRALADVGNHEQALDVLNRAHTPDRPDWRILNAQGAVLDQLGRHQDAQRYYATARIVPEEPAVLSNLGLSYALSKNLPEAETTLKRAAAGRGADRRVRQNLALVVGLQGRFAEAEAIARADLPAEEAAANVAYLRQMLSQQNALQAQGRPKRPAARPSS